MDLVNAQQARRILDRLVGLETPKKSVRELVATVKAIVAQRGKSVLNSINTNLLITGLGVRQVVPAECRVRLYVRRRPFQGRGL